MDLLQQTDNVFFTSTGLDRDQTKDGGQLPDGQMMVICS